MNSLQWTLLMVIALGTFPLVVWWGLWCVAAMLALLPARSRSSDADALLAGERFPPASRGLNQRVTIDVLIPAHDEEILLPRLLETLRLQTAAGRARLGRVLVIADHCTDRTAAIAREHHVEVLERNSGPRGKPAALRDGIAHLAGFEQSEHQKSILFLDADCTTSPNLLEQTAAALDDGAKATQAAYLLTSPTHGRMHEAATLAFALKNLIRPRGLSHFGIPSQLFGTGMCLHSDLLARVRFDDHLTEDLAISYDLLLAGIEPRFLPAALVRSPLPEQRGAMSTQKLRWEAGQVATWSKLPVIFARLLLTPGTSLAHKLRATVAVIDWSAPPLAMALFFACGVLFASLLLAALQLTPAWAAAMPLGALALLTAYIIIGVFQISGTAAVGRLILALPRFLFWKVSLYTKMLAGQGPRAWHRTPRTQAESKG